MAVASASSAPSAGQRAALDEAARARVNSDGVKSAKRVEVTASRRSGCGRSALPQRGLAGDGEVVVGVERGDAVVDAAVGVQRGARGERRRQRVVGKTRNCGR